MQPPPPRPPGSSGQQTVIGIIVGLLVGAMVTGGLVGIAGYAWVKRTEYNARKGWSLVPTLVAATDLPGGTMLTYDHLSQRSIPEQFVTASHIKPDAAASVVNSVLLVPVNAGQPLRWSHLQGGGRQDQDPSLAVSAAACAKALAARPDAPRAFESVEQVRAEVQRSRP